MGLKGFRNGRQWLVAARALTEYQSNVIVGSMSNFAKDRNWIDCRGENEKENERGLLGS